MEHLVPCFWNGWDEVREATASALDSQSWKPADDTERALLAIALQQWRECHAIGKAAIEPLLNVIHLQGAMGALIEIGDDAVEPLQQALQDGGRVRGENIIGLGRENIFAALGAIPGGHRTLSY